MNFSTQFHKCLDGHDYEIVHYWFRDVVAGSVVIESLLVDKKCIQCGFELDNIIATKDETKAIYKMDGRQIKE